MIREKKNVQQNFSIISSVATRIPKWNIKRTEKKTKENDIPITYIMQRARCRTYPLSYYLGTVAGRTRTAASADLDELISLTGGTQSL